jgi:signal transduction histidine kinase
MSRRKAPVQASSTRIKRNEALVQALKSHQVDAIVGKRHIMVVRLKQAEEELENSRDQLRALAARLQSTRESERGMIARELHDEFGQTLTSLHLGLSWLSRKLTAQQQPLQEKITALSATTTSMIQSVRNITSELRPGTVDELGLVKALKAEAQKFEGSTGIRCRFKTNTAKVKYDRSAEVAIFRIVQAAVTNVARHAHASRVLLALMKKKNNVILTVMDNGKGITRKMIYRPDSHGITGIRERALDLGGTFKLRGSRGKGTTLTVQIPLSRMVIGKAS